MRRAQDDAGRPVSAALTPGGLASAGPPLVLPAKEPPHWDAEAGKHVSTVQYTVILTAAETIGETSGIRVSSPVGNILTRRLRDPGSFNCPLPHLGEG